MSASDSMASGNGKAVLRRAFSQLEQEVPGKVARVLRSLRHPDARWIRIPAGVLLVLGGTFSILPLLGLWMLPLGLLLIAYDLAFLREPVGRFTLWLIAKWTSLRQRLFPSRSED
ncbi:hypothetical protein [Microvirga sp. KLBC 81]|uniref:hypothetical protein n=1 Tax=Microvirga sp. KLBC 81 TaxID=1862707 RepID=UPI001FDED5B3|nr:hypothetical protein [Microvirga sp. KLBC 81]